VCVAHAHPRLLAERRIEIRDCALEDSARGPSKSWIVFVAALRERSSRGLTKNTATATNHIVVSRLGAKLKRKRRVIIFSEQPEQEASCENERRRVGAPTIFQQSSHSRDRAYVREIIAVFARQRKNRVVPHSVPRLDDGELDRRPVRVREPVDVVGYRSARPSYLRDGPVFNGSGGVVEERQIKTGFEGATEVEVVSGLSEQDQVITSSRTLLQPGMKVQAKLEVASR
jgi:hypothetical protein